MKNIKSHILIFGLLFFLGVANAQSLSRGAATKYVVSVKQVSLCGDANCTSEYVVGTGSQNFDIASVNVGTAIGSYANTSAVPLGTYTHVKTIVLKSMLLTGSCGDGTGNGGNALKSNATLTVPYTGDGGLNLNGLLYFNAGGTVTWLNNVEGSDIVVITPLTNPFTVFKGMTTPPSISVAFKTSLALGCTSNSSAYFPTPPQVTITIQ